MASVLDVITASAAVRDGRLYIRDRKEFDALVAQLPEAWELEVTIQRRRATRSVQQNRYYWGVVLRVLADYTGYSVDELHDVMRAKFLPKSVALCDGNGVVVGDYVLGGSTRHLDIETFTLYIEAIREWAARELDCDIPDAEGRLTTGDETHGPE